MGAWWMSHFDRGNTPAMTEHIGGPESDDEVITRHENYLRYWNKGSARMFVIEADAVAVGGVGWWTNQWREADVHETGWFVVPEAQGRGIAAAAVALLIEDTRRFGTFPLLTAFPSVSNAPSNALCAKSGFALSGTEEFPFRGTILTVNAWVLQLSAH
jgi:RimJ/RimL family protein N-acetyltransferase